MPESTTIPPEAPADHVWGWFSHQQLKSMSRRVFGAAASVRPQPYVPKWGQREDGSWVELTIYSEKPEHGCQFSDMQFKGLFLREGLFYGARPPSGETERAGA